jgi:hypothetical protein
MSTKMDRRHFIRSSTGYAAALAAAALAPAIRAEERPSAAERLRLGFIACGGRAMQLMKIFKEFPDVEIAMVSDVLEPRMDAAIRLLAAEPNPHKPAPVMEHERILERKDIDAVVIATTEHWHGIPHIQACQAGKHIFVEKPLSHTIVEGRAMLQAAKKPGVIAMMETQQRAGEHYKKAAEIIHSGRLEKSRSPNAGIMTIPATASGGRRILRRLPVITGIAGSDRLHTFPSIRLASPTRGGLTMAAG